MNETESTITKCEIQFEPCSIPGTVKHRLSRMDLIFEFACWSGVALVIGFCLGGLIANL